MNIFCSYMKVVILRDTNLKLKSGKQFYMKFVVIESGTFSWQAFIINDDYDTQY